MIIRPVLAFKTNYQLRNFWYVCDSSNPPQYISKSLVVRDECADGSFRMTEKEAMVVAATMESFLSKQEALRLLV